MSGIVFPDLRKRIYQESADEDEEEEEEEDEAVRAIRKENMRNELNTVALFCVLIVSFVVLVSYFGYILIASHHGLASDDDNPEDL